MMLCSELTYESLVAWIDSELTRIEKRFRLGTRREPGTGEQNMRVEDLRAEINNLRTNIELGRRILRGELPELADRPWSSR